MTIETVVAGLNPGQQAATEEFFSFLFSDEREMGIDGPGGVGKTHTMSHMIDTIMPQYFETCKLMGIKPEYDEVIMTAMTNKAAEVLAVATGRPVSTIHSFMNLKVEDDFKTGGQKLSKTRLFKVHTNKIIFIDECSMMDPQLYKFIDEGTYNCKIIYVGDDRQLRAVIGSNPIYSKPIKWATLTQPMRTTIPEVLALHTQLRETVATGEFKPIRIIPGVIDHLDDDQMQAEIFNHFMAQTLESRILAYTNKRVIQYNDWIRNLRGLPTEYTIGEFLVNNRAIQLPSAMLRVEEEVEIVDIGATQDRNIDGAVLKVQLMDLRTRTGEVLSNVPIASDRDHLANLIAHFSKVGKSGGGWSEYFDLRNTYPDLRQRDAATVYKAQGSTYQNVFIDLGDISTCRNADQAARMLYVGLSRMRARIFLFGQLADKYGGLVY